MINGFYEWKTETKMLQKKKQPYYVHNNNDNDNEKPLKLACIYDAWQSNNSEKPLYTFSILTCPSNPSLQWLHDRQPLILDDDEADIWMDNTLSLALPLLQNILHRSGSPPSPQESSSSSGNGNSNSSSSSNSSTSSSSYLPTTVTSHAVTPRMSSGGQISPPPPIASPTSLQGQYLM
jgi:putative SOS response-associated peptidase YedK